FFLVYFLNQVLSTFHLTLNLYCKNCQKCIDACPAKALQNGQYKRDRCYEYQITHLNKLSNYSSIWCNICIESCPIGKDKKKK
ncbi:MAG: 4Fe-4S double cluster binding domain-containing protein, partial [Candidatus Hodarchaeota archaeon]